MATDPRLRTAAKTVNEELLDEAIRHAAMVDRFRASLQRTMRRRLDREVLQPLLDEITKELSKIQEGKRTRTRLERLQRFAVVVGQQVRGTMRPLRQSMLTELRRFAATESGISLAALRSLTPLRISFTAPSLQQIRNMVTNVPYQGRTFNEWMNSLNRRTASRVKQAMNQGLVQGESIDDIVRRIRGTGGVFQETRRNLQAIVRTSATHVSAQARELTYSNNEDVVKGVQYVATLDARTTEICAGLDGRVFEVNEGPRPPMHVNCRSTTVPVLKSWEELGIPARELDPSTRASMNGQVSEDVTFNQWLKRQSKGVQNEVLGATRGKLFREGKISVDRLTDQQNRPLTLDQIKKREGLTDGDLKLR